jgi:hypothetical protein
MAVLKPTKKHEPMKCLQRWNMDSRGKKILWKEIRTEKAFASCNIYIIFGKVVKIANGQVWNSNLSKQQSVSRGGTRSVELRT